MDTTQKAQCTVVNAFLRDIDVYLATRATLAIPCKSFRTRIYKIGLKYRHKETQALVLKAALMIWKRVMCKNDVTVNIAEIRRDISRLQCFVDDTEAIQLRIQPLQKDSPPLPKGFIRPRQYPGAWSPEWARENNWIQDPYHDWLEPAKNTRDKVEFFPKPFSLTSFMISCVCVLAVIGGVWYWMQRSKKRAPLGPSQTDIDEEFMNAPPPTTNLEVGMSMPSTTDLMKEFQSVQRAQSTQQPSQ